MEPVHSALVVQDAALAARSLSLAHRLLAGSGRAGMLAYDLSPMVEAQSVCHAMTEAGELLVACVADADVPVTTWGQLPLRIRLEVVKEAPEWSVRIAACAVHLLGTLEWLSDAERDERLADPRLDANLAALAGSFGGRLGVVTTDRVLLHDSAGVTPLAFEEIVETHLTRAVFPGPDDEWFARELVGAISPMDALDLFAAADAGWDAAIELSGRQQDTCPHMDGQLYCVDIDRIGLTLMTVADSFSRVVLFTFERPANNAEELAEVLGQLLDTATGVACGGIQRAS